MGLYHEQLEEISVLEAMYQPDEFSVLSKQEDDVRVQLLLKGDPHDEDRSHIGCALIAELPPQYPQVAPRFIFSYSKGISEGELVRKMKPILIDAAERSLGFALLMEVFTEAQLWMEDNNAPQQTAYDLTAHAIEERRVLREQLEAEEERKRAEAEGGISVMVGLELRTLVKEWERCTEAKFDEWEKKFIQQQEESGAWQREDEAFGGRLTGRQIFTKGYDNDTRPELNPDEDLPEMDEDLLAAEDDLEEIEFSDDE